MESEIYTGAPCPEPPRFVRTRRKSWSELRQVVRDVRCRLYHTACKIPANVVFCRKPSGVRIYFLCSIATGREMTLHFVDVNEKGELSKCQTLFESKFHSSQSSSSSYARSSKEEQLQLERKRVMMCGIAAFDYVAPGHFAFSSAGSVFRCRDQLPLGVADRAVFPEEVRPAGPNRPRTRLDPQICPFDPDVIAYISNNDIWVYNWSSGNERRLTDVHESRATLSAGVPCYVTQEEFNRFSGFWWAPKSIGTGNSSSRRKRSSSESGLAGPAGTDKIRYSILYEVVDESEVEVIELPNATGGVEEYRFPRAGTPNAKSSLRLVSFSVASNGTFVDLTYVQVSNPYIDAAEYILRAGWTPDACFIWAQLLNRQQDTLQLVLVRVHRVLCNAGREHRMQHHRMETDVSKPAVPPGSKAVSSNNHGGGGAVGDGVHDIKNNGDDDDDDDDSNNNNDHDVDEDDDGLVTNATVLLEEKSSVWINVHDVLYFLPSPCSRQIAPPAHADGAGTVSANSESPSSPFGRVADLSSSGDGTNTLMMMMENGFGHAETATTTTTPAAAAPTTTTTLTHHGRHVDAPYQECTDNCEPPRLLEFVWASETTGFRHLYLYRIDLDTGMCLERRPLTGGQWEVNDKDIWVDHERRIVYFIGLKDSPLEKQLYVVSLDETLGPVQCLTSMGASHQAFVSPDCSLVVTIESHLSQPAFARLHRLVAVEAAPEDGSVSMALTELDGRTQLISTKKEPMPVAETIRSLHCRPHMQLIGNLMEPASVDEEYRVPELFRHQLSSGDTVYGVIFKPRSLDVSRPHKFPTVLTIYGGPEVQLVTNSFKGMRHLRQHLLSSEDFCVVTMDCRGSRNRGVAFESHLRGRMGQVEIQDQVEVLQWLAEDRGYIDINRVAIHGWSYGGYLSLMALAQRPDIFKLAVAGAPVTQWSLYDTGYTERYMGLPESNREGYHRGSVLSHVGQFPDEEGRLLLIHGLMDENVHFAHTTSLIQALVKAGKPYRLQVYPQERHSLRHLATSEHYETTLLSFLQDNL